MSDPKQWLEGLDAPRALSPDLRGRLASQLVTTEESRPLDDALAARLADRLTDPVADLLHDLDAPRALSPELRTALHAELSTPRSARWVAVAAGAVGVAAATVVAIVLAGSGPTSPPPQDVAGGSPGVHASATPGTVAGGAPLPVLPPGVPVLPGSVAGPPTTPAPAPAAPAAPATAPEPASGEASIGYYRGEPQAMPAEGGPQPAPSPTPNVSARAPDAGPLAGGTTVRISGSHLGGARSVVFGEVTGTGLRVLDDNHLTVVSPAHAAGTVDLVVRFDGPGEFVVPDGFSFLKAPRLESVSPDNGDEGSWVVLSGDALSRVTTVRFGDTAAREVQVVSDTSLRVLVPPHAIGPVDITATSPGGESNAIRFLYLP